MPLLTAGDDKTQARRLQRLAKQGRLRRIYAGVYTDDLAQPLETVVRRELLALCALIAPGAILSHRSALESSRTTPAGNVFLTGSQRRDFKLPGVTLRMVIGVGPLESDIRVPTLSGDVYIASQARAARELERKPRRSGGAPDRRRRICRGMARSIHQS